MSHNGKKLPTKVRSFVFTNFDLTIDYAALIDPDTLRYIAYGAEVCPTTGKDHHQGWLYFKNQRGWGARALKGIAKLLGGNCHIEPMVGSFKDSDAYCSKESELITFGEKPVQGDRSDIKDLISSMQAGDTTADEICLANPEMYHQYGRTLSKAEDVMLRKKFRTWMTEADWYWGDTGVGKSHIAFKDFDPATHYTKPLNDKWWDGYTGQETVILNEFRGSITYSELLSMIDKWVHYVPRRNREPIPFLAKKVIITSSKSPYECFRHMCADDNIDQLLRRCKVYRVLGHDDMIEDTGATDFAKNRRVHSTDLGDFMDGLS